MLRQNKGVSSHLKKGVPKPIADTICRYKTRTCHQPALDNYDYCLKHILEDKSAPYRPCSYAYPSNNKRCFIPAPKLDKNDTGYCALHLWKTQVKSQRSTSKHVPPTTPEYLLSGLSHYVRPARGGIKGDGEDSKNSNKIRAINPFVEADVNKAAQGRSYVLECASESDSDVEPSTLDNIWKGANEDSSDAESIDSQLDDPLKHAGHYTAEEVVSVSRNKLVRLQVLYQKQFERLQYVFRERRRDYLHSLRKEKETLSSIYDQAKTSAKEQKLYDKLKALNRYHRRTKAESLAYLLMLEKRAKDIGGPNSKQPGPSSRCSFTEGGVRCSKVTVPLTKFCFKHILEDNNQCLFRACGCVKADISCQVPVVGIGSDETCLLHVRLPVLPHSNYPDTSIKMDVDGDKKSNDGSEVDASATESAFSTDQRDSPENSIINNEDLSRTKDEDSELFCDKGSFPEACESDLQESIMDTSENNDCGKEVVINGDNNESLDSVPI